MKKAIIILVILGILSFISTKFCVNSNVYKTEHLSEALRDVNQFVAVRTSSQIKFSYITDAGPQIPTIFGYDVGRYINRYGVIVHYTIERCLGVTIDSIDYPTIYAHDALISTQTHDVILEEQESLFGEMSFQERNKIDSIAISKLPEPDFARSHQNFITFLNSIQAQDSLIVVWNQP